MDQHGSTYLIPVGGSNWVLLRWVSNEGVDRCLGLVPQSFVGWLTRVSLVNKGDSL